MPSDHTIEPWNDPAIEARIVALILGEASDYERAELEDAMAADPGLASLHHRLSTVHKLLSANKFEATSNAGESADWKLSPERRAKVLETIATDAPPRDGEDIAPTADGTPGKTSQWRRFAAVAAVFVVVCAIARFGGFPFYKVMERQEQAANFKDYASTQHLSESDGAEVGSRTETGKYEEKPADRLGTLTAKKSKFSPPPMPYWAMAGKGKTDANERWKYNANQGKFNPRKPNPTRPKKLAAVAPLEGNRVFAGRGTAGDDRDGISSLSDYTFLPPSEDETEATGSFPVTSGLRFGLDALRPAAIDERLFEHVYELLQENTPSKPDALAALDTPFGQNPSSSPRRGNEPGLPRSKNGQIAGYFYDDLDTDEAFPPSPTRRPGGRNDGDIKPLERQIRKQSERLEKARVAMLDCVENYNIVDLSLGVPSWLRGGKPNTGIGEIVMDAKRKAFAAETAIQDLKTTLKALENLSGDDKITAAVELGIQNPTLITRYPEYQNLLLSRDQLIEGGLGIGHSKVVSVDKQIELIQGMLDGAVDTAKKALGTRLAMAKQTLENANAAKERSAKLSLAERRENVAYIKLKKDYERQKESLMKMRSLLTKKTASPPANNKAKATPSPVLSDLEKFTADEPFSTFSLSVSDVSFKLAKAALLDGGSWPDAAKIRPEEFVNAFDYGDPSPSLDERVACALEQCAHPFLQQRNLLRISMKTAAAGRATGQPLRLTVLLDKSGSMERADREASVAKAFEVLAGLLGEHDVISVIGFARTPSLIADRLPGARAGELAALVAAAPSEGGTNLEEALRLADETAARQFLASAQNRIVLITDGAANLGDASPESLQQRIIGMRRRGIAFDACGVGADGLNDEILETLARKGDGRYYFLDKPEDADAGFVRQLAGALRPAARNVKVQVKFNPGRVTRYRLSGFEKHRLNKEDFRNDAVDAAEIAAAEAGNALYQIEVDPAGQGDIGEVSVRFQDTASGAMVERCWPIRYRPNAPRLDEAAPSMQLAATAGLLGEKLRGGPAGEAVDLAELATIATALRNGPFGDIERVRQLVQMVGAMNNEQ